MASLKFARARALVAPPGRTFHDVARSSSPLEADLPRTRFVPAIPLLLFGLASCGGSDSPTDNSLECSGGTVLGLGASATTGTLQNGDDLDFDGAYLDRYSLAIQSGATVRITMRTAAFDSFLWLLTSGGTLIESDDDGGGGLDAQITDTLGRGCYLIEATSLVAGQTGSYTLTAESL